MEKYTESQKRPSQAKRTLKRGTSYKQHNITQEKNFNYKEVKTIADEIYTIIAYRLVDAKTKEEERDIIKTITDTYLTKLVNYGEVKDENDLHQKYIKPYTKEILKNNKQKRKLNYKLHQFYYKLIMAKAEEKEEEIKQYYFKLSNDVVKFGIYSTEDEYKAFIESILSDKKENLIIVDKADKYIKISKKNENDKILEEHFYADDKLMERVVYKYNDTNNTLISKEYYNSSSNKTQSIKYEYYEDDINLKREIELNNKSEKVGESFFINGSEIPTHCIQYNPQTGFKTKEVFFYENTTNPKQHITYNEQEQKTDEKFYKNDGKTLNMAFEYEYDEQNRLETIYRYNNERKLEETNKFIYNTDGSYQKYVINKDNMCISTEYYNENNTETMKIDHVPYLDAKYSDKVIYCGSSDTYVTTAYLDENNNYIDINIEPQIDIDSLPELAQELIVTTQKEVEENENKVEKQTTNSNENKLVQIKLKTLTEKIDSAFKEIKSFETTDYPSLENTKQISTIKYPYLSYNINSIDKLSTNIKWHKVTEEYQKTLIENMKTILIKAQEEIKQSTNNNYNTKTETKMLEDCTDDISEISCGNNYCIAIND